LPSTITPLVVNSLTMNHIIFGHAAHPSEYPKELGLVFQKQPQRRPSLTNLGPVLVMIPAKWLY